MLFWFVSTMMVEIYFFYKKRKYFSPNLLIAFFFMWPHTCSNENKLQRSSCCSCDHLKKILMSIQERTKTGFGNAHLNLNSRRSIRNSAVLATQPNARSLELAITAGSPAAAVCVCVCVRTYICLREGICHEKQEAVFYGKSFQWLEKAGIVTLNVLAGKLTAQEVLNSPLSEERC